jgi:hypothetical protein
MHNKVFPSLHKIILTNSKEAVSKVRDSLFLFGQVMESNFIYSILSTFILLLIHPLFLKVMLVDGRL